MEWSGHAKTSPAHVHRKTCARDFIVSAALLKICRLMFKLKCRAKDFNYFSEQYLKSQASGWSQVSSAKKPSNQTEVLDPGVSLLSTRVLFLAFRAFLLKCLPVTKKRLLW